MAPQSDELTLHVERVVHARPSRVFVAMTDPEQVAQWWGPHSFATSIIELDLRAGGKYRFAMQPPEGDRFYLHGEYREIDVASRLAYTFRWEPPDPQDVETVVRISLSGLGGWTRLTMVQGVFATPARKALHEQGWSDSLERLQAYLSSPGVRS